MSYLGSIIELVEIQILSMLDKAMLEVSSKITVSKEKLELLTLTLDQWVKVQLMMMMCLIVYLYIYIYISRTWMVWPFPFQERSSLWDSYAAPPKPTLFPLQPPCLSPPLKTLHLHQPKFYTHSSFVVPMVDCKVLAKIRCYLMVRI